MATTSVTIETTGNPKSTQKQKRVKNPPGEKITKPKPPRNVGRQQQAMPTPARQKRKRPQLSQQERIAEVTKKRIESFLLGPESPSQGFLYHRDDNRPVCHKLFDFVKVIKANDFDDDIGLSFNIRPNPYRTLELVKPPVGGNKAKDDTESISVQTHMQNPTSWCFDHDITLQQGSLLASNHVVKNFPVTSHYSTGTKEFKEGNKIYPCGPSTFQTEPAVVVSNPATYDVNHEVLFYAILKDGGNGGLIVGSSASTTQFTVGHGQDVEILASQSFGQFQAEMAGPDAYGFAVVDVVSVPNGESITTTGMTMSIKLGNGNPERLPIFGAAYTIQPSSIFDLIGPAADVLKLELERCTDLAVTGYGLLVTNYSAPINKAGRIIGAEYNSNHTEGLVLEPDARIATLSNLPKSVYRMHRPATLDRGIHFSTILTRDLAEFVPRSLYTDIPGTTSFLRPYAAVAIDGKGAFNEGVVPSLQLVGWLNVEWRTTSITIPPNVPPANIGWFMDVLFSAMKSLPAGSLWGENPDHLKKIKRLAAAIVGSPRFKTVLRDIGTVGLESFAALLI